MHFPRLILLGFFLIPSSFTISAEITKVENPIEKNDDGIGGGGGV